jgi:hypothetical protein
MEVEEGYGQQLWTLSGVLFINVSFLTLPAVLPTCRLLMVR